MASRTTATGLSVAIENGPSDSCPPTPQPRIMRPLLSSSIVIAVEATAPGWRNSGEVMPTPNVMRRVTWAAAARRTNGSRATPSSATHTSSTPASSSATIASTIDVAGSFG